MKSFKGIVLVAVLMLLGTGCASVPLADPAADAEAKKFELASDKASVYVYRNESFGGAIKMAVFLNDRPVGQSGPKTYFHWSLEPGTYKITSKAENTSDLTIDVEAGKDYYIWQEVKMGLLSARSKLQKVDETKGRAGVRESRLIASYSK